MTPKNQVDGVLQANYWLTGQPNHKHKSLYIGNKQTHRKVRNNGFHDILLSDLGCVVEVVGFLVTNTHNHIWNDYSTKDFTVYLRYISS